MFLNKRGAPAAIELHYKCFAHTPNPPFQKMNILERLVNTLVDGILFLPDMALIENGIRLAYSVTLDDLSKQRLGEITDIYISFLDKSLQESKRLTIYSWDIYHKKRILL